MTDLECSANFYGCFASTKQQFGLLHRLKRKHTRQLAAINRLLKRAGAAGAMLMILASLMCTTKLAFIDAVKNCAFYKKGKSLLLLKLLNATFLSTK